MYWRALSGSHRTGTVSGVSEPAERRIDVGATHVALTVTDLDASLAFWATYANMSVVHRRRDDGEVAWISDLTRPFVMVLIETDAVSHPLGGWAHIGVGVDSRDEVNARCAAAAAKGITVLGPIDSGPPVGYWAFLSDPDGHNLELSFGQEVGLTVEEHQAAEHT